MGRVCPNPHKEAFFIAKPNSSRNSRSFSSPSPLHIFVNISRSAAEPSRQEEHFPHDSSLVKERKYLAKSTMHVPSSKMIIPPEPIIEPTSVSRS